MLVLQIMRQYYGSKNVEIKVWKKYGDKSMVIKYEDICMVIKIWKFYYGQRKWR